MKKQIVAIVLLLVLMLPMFAGISRIKRLPREKPRDEPPEDER